ncbi:MAG TPA: YegS/Rv2252/BmrU family lipid kinase [Draconibacterium sp.]|nr:YegS/Rv2252/BmrU family lipid kinase [Draconibacterium sp.]
MNNQHQKKIFLIINRFAGNGKKRSHKIDKAISWLKTKAGEVESAYTNHPGHATELASVAAAGDFNIVVAVGGDGTVNEVAQGLIGTSASMGIIPMGSGNGLARELGIPMDILKSAQMLVTENSQRIDVCSIGRQRFLCTAGVGFDAQVAHKMSKASSRGFLRYIQLTVSESMAFKPFRIKMKVDDVIIEKPVFLVTFANASQFGNNAYIAPSASMTDELIDVVVVNPFNKILLPVFGIGLFARFIPKLKFVECYKAKQIDIEFAETSIYHFDGEPGELNIPAKITIEPEKLGVIGGN